jgi:hypothetical protein
MIIRETKSLSLSDRTCNDLPPIRGIGTRFRLSPTVSTSECFYALAQGQLTTWARLTDARSLRFSWMSQSTCYIVLSFRPAHCFTQNRLAFRSERLRSLADPRSGSRSRRLAAIRAQQVCTAINYTPEAVLVRDQSVKHFKDWYTTLPPAGLCMCSQALGNPH